MEYTLNMVFLTAGANKTTFSVSGIKPTLTADEVNTLMNSILTENIFTTASGDLVSKSSAAIVAKKSTEVKIA